MKAYLLDFLGELENLIPPPHGYHHSITCRKYGSESTGFKEVLSVDVMDDRGSFNCYFLEEKDFEKKAINLASEVGNLHTTKDHVEDNTIS